MKRMLTLTLWIAVGVSLLGLTTVGSATAGITKGVYAHRPPVHVINLHKVYAARLGHATTGPIAGILPTEGTKPIHGRGGNNCSEPHCAVSYNGGPVQHSPHVYLLLWGPNWSKDPNQAATASWLESFYQGLGQPEDNWSTTTSQYNDGTGHPTFNGSVYVGAYQDTSTPPTGAGQANLAAEADAFASAQGIADLNDAQIVVATQSGTCPAGFAAPTCGGVPGDYCAWHSYSNEPYTNLPYILDAGTACGEDFVNSSGTYDGFTIAGSHEYADTITDPYPESGWWDPSDPNLFQGEIADKCAWNYSHDVALKTGTFAMQPLWSNSADGCVMPIGGNSDKVTVQNPGSQSTYQESRLSLSVAATSTRQHPLTWSAAGLPAGLTIASGGNGIGIIRGQVTAAPGTYTVTVQASDSTGAFGWVSFEWKVKADVGSTIKNVGAGLCLNDHGYSINPGNQIVMWACLNGPAEKWSHPTNTGELIILGQCLTDPSQGGGGAGALQIIEPCTGAPSQEWLHNSKNEYVLEKNFLCLTDPNGSRLNGEPAVIDPCVNAPDQRWLGS